MFSIIGPQILSPCASSSNDTVKTVRKGLVNLLPLLDIAGAITLIVLGALSLYGIGGNAIASLNSIPGGGWGMIAGGVVVMLALYAIYRQQGE